MSRWWGGKLASNAGDVVRVAAGRGRYARPFKA